MDGYRDERCGWWVVGVERNGYEVEPSAYIDNSIIFIG